MISRAGFQPVHLAEINFHALYEQRLAQAAGASAPGDSGIILPN
jgi:preprotein translocase subunit SecB